MRTGRFTRRDFLGSAVAGAAAVSVGPSWAQAKYRRCIVTSDAGKKALASYAKAIQVMLKLPPEDPRNWFRNAAVHLMDCPHTNWWFYAWHRGYVGYFEQNVRELSGDKDFAFPYWDWTALPEIPASMFEGVLTPTDSAYLPYTESLDVFAKYFKPTLQKFWDGLSPAQRQQQALRGHKTFDDLWMAVSGGGDPGNGAFAPTKVARWLSPANPKLDADAMRAVSATFVSPGLKVTEFAGASGITSFTSSITQSHVQTPRPGFASILESNPHNLVHNCIGGANHIQPPYGYMTQFLSPVDPIFFLHHSNMDRLWDVWTRRQQAAGRPFLPAKGAQFDAFAKEPFLFFIDGTGRPVKDGKAGDYLSTERFNFDYDHAGFGDDLATPNLAGGAGPLMAAGRVAGNVATLDLPEGQLRAMAAPSEASGLAVQVTVRRPSSDVRQFRVFLDASPNAQDEGTDSPSFVGTAGFFGPEMPGMAMDGDFTFTLPLPERHPTFAAAKLAAPQANGAAKPALTLRVVPLTTGLGGADNGGASVLKAAAIRSL